jgi:hypothetical protein
MAKYRLLVGQHVDNHPSHEGDHVYVPGDIIDTDKDLLRFNGVGMSPKFERLHDTSAGDVRNYPPPTPPEKQLPPAPKQVEPVTKRPGDDDKLDTMTTQQLKEYAAENEIDITGCTRKDEILERIRQG